MQSLVKHQPDSFTHAPIDPGVREQLEERYEFPGGHLDDLGSKQQKYINLALGKIGVAMELGKPESLEPVAGVHPEPRRLHGPFEGEYDWERYDPRVKMERDVTLARNARLALGHTNTLRDAQGRDAGIALGRFIYWLEADYFALPEDEQHVELRMEEGYLRQELALMWRPDTLEKFRNHEQRAFMFDLEDPNIFSEEEINNLTEEERWWQIGIKLSDEAAGLFWAIAESETVDPRLKAEAFCRAVDMETRSLRLRAELAPDDATKQELFEEIDALNIMFMKDVVDDMWAALPDKLKTTRSWGFFLEYIVVGLKRDEYLRSDDPQSANVLVRLAHGRQDGSGTTMKPFKTVDGKKVKLGIDVVAEGIDGRYIMGFQSKLASRENYESKHQNEEYPEDLVEMVHAAKAMPGS